MGDDHDEAISGLVASAWQASRLDLDIDASDRGHSHTFGEGQTGLWHDAFIPTQARRLLAVAGPVLERYDRTEA